MKTINNLSKGDEVYYIGLDGKHRKLTYIGQNGFVRCVKGRGYTPNFVFDYEGAKMHAPLEAWLFTRMKYTIIEATKSEA